MIAIELAFLVDLILGDPKYSFHPVRLMGKLAKELEIKFNRDQNKFIKGLITTLFFYFIVILVVGGIEFILSLEIFPEYVLFSFQVFAFYTCFALRDLIDHARRVYSPLKNSNINLARNQLSYLVGRNTKSLNESEICRGTIESLAENLVDGVTAPLFYAALFGLKGVFLYKAINTLDSLWGHKNERYSQFGKFAAKVDDVFNYIPARITAPLISFSALIINQRMIASLRILFRDGKKHPSPNSGLPEAAMAGALGVQLGGENEYYGTKNYREYLGDPNYPLEPRMIKISILITFLTSIIFLFLLSTVIGFF